MLERYSVAASSPNWENPHLPIEAAIPVKEWKPVTKERHISNVKNKKNNKKNCEGLYYVNNTMPKLIKMTKEYFDVTLCIH